MYVLLLKIAFYGLFIGGGVGVIGVPISRKKDFVSSLLANLCGLLCIPSSDAMRTLQSELC